MRKGPHIRHPKATVIPYGPDDETVTKLVVAIFPTPQDTETTACENWIASDVATNGRIASQINDFLMAHRVKTVITATAIMGCPHEEEEDFPLGGDCPFCPFWAGKQGSGTDDSRWDRLKALRVERFEGKYRFWLP